MGKKTLMRILAAVLAFSISVYNVGKMIIFGNAQTEKVNVDFSAVEEIGKADIASVQKKINENKTKSIRCVNGSVLNIYNPEETNKIAQRIKNGETSYSKIFEDTLIAGDSLIEAINAYGIMDRDIVMGKVSASLYELDGISGKIISYRPKTLILHYGENHVGGSTQVYVNNFTEFYTTLIKRFQKELPDTRIVVSSIFLPNSKGLASSPYLKGVPRFNEGLRKMCAKLNVEFLDNTPLFSDKSTFYEPDGVHVKRIFYTDYWLPYMAYALKLA